MQNVHIGVFPPPLGGVSVHFYRRSKIEKDAIFLDQRDLTGFIKFRVWIIKNIFDLRKKNYIYHLNSFGVRISLFIMSYISVHNFSLVLHGRSFIDEYNKANIFKKFILTCIFNRAHYIQVVNLDYKKFLKSIKVKNNNILVKHAFIPPPFEDESKLLKSYNKELLDYLNKRNPIIVANAFEIRFYNKIDLYGLDLCVDLTKLLKRDYPNIGFLFALANNYQEIDYLNKIQTRIKELNIENNFYFMMGQKELWPLFKKVDLMVRPTNTDGDSISIREALFLNVPVVTSDVVSRPEKCILFKNRDLEDFYSKCKNVLKNTV